MIKAAVFIKKIKENNMQKHHNVHKERAYNPSFCIQCRKKKKVVDKGGWQVYNTGTLKGADAQKQKENEKRIKKVVDKL